MPNWADFQRKHVLSPAEAPGCLHWNRTQWNTWLQKRLPNDFGGKRVNSVVVSTPEAIMNDFQTLNHEFAKNDFYWSNHTYRVFGLVIDHRLPADAPYRVYNFGEMFILAKISRNPNVPVHFEAQNTIRPNSGRPNVNFSNYPVVSD
ncbi:hypothetical protein HA402_010672 [Bradysia odoriphaga]|nr:hypothetical protein HA402_010672 [Bradysia odoriphaga]